MDDRSLKSSTSSYICEALLMDLLARLPPKSLLRFTCTSKSWRDLIHSSMFVTAHLNRNATSNSHLLATVESKPNIRHYSLISTTGTLVERPLDLRLLLGPSKDPNRYAIYGSSNGLVCISESPLRLKSPVCIWNPSIQKWRALPSANNNFRRECISMLFGYCPKFNDYKVVRIIRPLEAEIYSLSQNSWQMGHVISPWLNSNICNDRNHQQFWNGVAHWLVRKGEESYGMLSFNTGDKNFQEIMVPDSFTGTPSSRILVQVYNESICLLRDESFADGRLQIEMWVLQEDRSFEKLHSLSVPMYAGSLKGLSFDNKVVMHNGMLLTLFKVETTKDDSKDGDTLRMCSGDLTSIDGFYTNSLVLLDD